MSDINLDEINIEEINFGFDFLDENIAEFIRIARDDEKIRKIKSLVQDESLEFEDYRREIPEALFNLIPLFDDIGFKNITRDLTGERKEVLEAVKDFFDEELSDFIEHPGTIEFITNRADEEFQQEQEEETSPEDIFENLQGRIKGIMGEVTWKGDPPNLIPTRKIVFLGNNDEVLFSGTFDIDDLLFTVGNFFDGIELLFDKSEEINDYNLIRFGDLDELERKINSLEGKLDNIRSLIKEVKDKEE